jgi:cation:H+ antiporter
MVASHHVRLADSILFFLLGAGLLAAGGHVLVEGAASLARRLSLSPLVVGLTVVAWGTSAPELAVSLGAVLRGHDGIALGNVVGSNIFNVLVVLGASAIVAPLVVSRRLVWRDVPVLVALSLLVHLLAGDGRLGRVDGAILFLAGPTYLVSAVRAGRREPTAPREGAEHDRSLAAGGGLVLLGLLLLVLGSRWLVAGASVLARAAGMSELVIGLTIVAVGTSLPEVAASLSAAWRGERDMAVGNAIGSNVFNIVNVLGLSALLSPSGIAVANAARAFDLPVMLAVAFACLPIFFTGHVVARWEGAVLLGYYAAYAGYLVLEAQRHDLLPLLSRTLAFFVIPLTVLTMVVVVAREWRSRGAPPS